MSALLHFWLTHAAELARLVEQHVLLVAVSTGVATALGIPAGIVAFRRPRLGRPLLFVANVAQTIPSLALFGFLLPLPFIGGVGPRTAMVALTLYALLPIVRTTVGGLRGLDPAVREAGVAMGMTPRQLLLMVEMPLAMPSIVAGLRVATVIGVGTATIAAAIGAGGLGEYIFRGLSMVDSTTILAGAVPAAAMALVADGGLALLEHRLERRRRSRTALTVGSVIAGVTAAAVVAWSIPSGAAGAIVVGSKNFTEQIVLGQIVAQAIQAEGLPVTRKLNLGGTFICDSALRSGDVDIYVEYTGTAVTAVFHQDVPHDRGRAFEEARQLYAEAGLTAFRPLGFNDTFAILVRGADARQQNLRTIDDLRRVEGGWTPGFGYEFLQRADGYPGLIAAYGLTFGHPPRAMDLSLIYKALADGQLDVIAGDATNGLVDSLGLVALQDDRGYFPPYDAVPVARTATVLRHPEIGKAMSRLAGRITERDVRAMNRAVDVDHRDPGDVAREFLNGLD
jgi:glycine betaine/choline ABC-type transport system substrate-binding protein/ABC-type proline/glycine betaine transport system permease subunit